MANLNTDDIALSARKEKVTVRDCRAAYSRARLPLAKPAPIRGVHLQQADRRSADRSAPDNDDSVALEPSWKIFRRLLSSAKNKIP